MIAGAVDGGPVDRARSAVPSGLRPGTVRPGRRDCGPASPGRTTH